MKPPSLTAATTMPTVQPLLGGTRLPALPIPASRALRTLERAARDYGRAHAAAVGYPAPRLAVAAFDVLCRHHGLTPHPLPDGRWTSRPPAQNVTAARARLAGESHPRKPKPQPTPPTTSAPF